MNQNKFKCKLKNYIENTICQTYDVKAIEDSYVSYIDCDGCFKKEAILKDGTLSICSKVVPWSNNIILTDYTFAGLECTNKNIPFELRATVNQYTYDGLDVALNFTNSSNIANIATVGGINGTTDFTNFNINEGVQYKILELVVSPGSFNPAYYITVKIEKDGIDSFIIKNSPATENKTLYIKTGNNKANELKIEGILSSSPYV